MFSSTGQYCSPILHFLSSICNAWFIQSSGPLEKTQYVANSISDSLFKSKAKGFISHVSLVSLPALVLKQRMKKQSKQNVSAGSETSSTSSSSSSSFSVSDRVTNTPDHVLLSPQDECLMHVLHLLCKNLASGYNLCFNSLLQYKLL